jgi:SAM-dependent methyltransferase
VLAGGAGGAQIARSLAPWVRTVHRLEQPAPLLAAVDWVFFSGSIAPDAAGVARSLQAALTALRPGGHVVLTLENRWGLHWLADWRVTDDTAAPAGGHEAVRRHGLPWHRRQLCQAGAEDLRSYALLPSRDAPRAIIPVDPPCPAPAQRMALDQVWQRATPAAAIARGALGLLVRTGLMARLYPHYLVVGRKPC